MNLATAIALYSGGPGSGRHPGIVHSAPPSPHFDSLSKEQQFNWAMHPTKGLVFDHVPGRTHVDWYPTIGLSNQGAAYDNIRRGNVTIKPWAKTLSVDTYQPGDISEVTRRVQESRPDTRGYAVSENHVDDTREPDNWD
jgi:hypothetical protein